jgi:hypothetical protein
MKNYFFSTMFFVLMACTQTTDPDPNTPVTGGTCALATISFDDGTAVGYSYDSKQRISKINLTGTGLNTTYRLDYDETQGNNGPVVSIGNPANSSLTILDYDKNNLMTIATTTFPKKDAGVILGKPATMTNFKSDLTFVWDSNKQLTRQNSKTSYKITSNNITEDLTINGYSTYTYDANGNLLKENQYTQESLTVGGMAVLSPGQLVASVTYEYETNISAEIQNTASTGLYMNLVDDGQIIFTPKSKKAVKKMTSNFSGTTVVTNYTNTANASGLLTKTVSVDKYGTETTTYSYNNCK